MSSMKNLVLVGCGSKKDPDATQDRPVPAKDLYKSHYFEAKRRLAEICTWRILTNYKDNNREYNLLSPECWVYSYEKIKTKKEYDEEWADEVVGEIQKFFPEGRIIILAGQDVWRVLSEKLKNKGYEVQTPLQDEVNKKYHDTRIGYQLKWMGEHEKILEKEKEKFWDNLYWKVTTKNAEQIG